MIKLYDHQRRAEKKALSSLIQNKYFAFFMEMGTGKTFTSLSVSKKLDISTTIVVCPKGIISSWIEQIPVFFDGEKVKIFVWDSKRVKTNKFQDEMSFFLSCRKRKFLIINIEAFQIKSELLNRLLFDLIKYEKTFCIVDESSKIKNHKARRTINLNQFNFQYRLIMTGTEISNSILDIYSQFNFLSKSFWKQNFYQFRSRYAVLKDMQLQSGRSFKVVVGFRKVDEIVNKIDPHIFRIKKEDCLDLPDKLYSTIKLKMNKDQQRIYDDLKSEMWAIYKDQELTAQNKVSLYIRFRQITGGFMPETGQPIGKENVKIEAIKEDAGDPEEYKHKILIWSAFRREVKELCNVLDAAQYDGEKKELEAFKNDKRIMVANPAAAAYGLNLQFCSNVYYFSRTLSLEENLQSEDRCHRIGQVNHVLYKDVICEGTVDEKVLKSIKSKKNMLNDFQTMGKDEFFDSL